MKPDIESARAVVYEQALDDRLWCRPGTIVEATLQNELRRLHEIIEGKSKETCALEAMGVSQH